MTVTEAPADSSSEAPRGDVGSAASRTVPEPRGLAALVGSGDPLTIGKLFIGTSLLFLLVAGVAGVLVGFEQIDSTSPGDVIGSDSVAQVITLHGVTGLFLVVLPLLLGLATAVVPLQVGASTVAFPRASAAAYWVYLVSGGLIMTAYAMNGGPYGGDNEGVALFVAAMVALLAALCLGTISVMTTVIALRAPGMSLRRVPLFSWSMLVAGTVWLLTLPVLAGLLVLAYVDFTYGQQFLGGAGGVYERIQWTFLQPTVYAFAIPALGIIGDIVPVFAQTRHRQHRVAMFLIGLFGALSFGAWAQPGVPLGDTSDPTPWLDEGPWIAVSFLIVLPMLGLLGLWSLTLQSGRPKPSSPLLFALVAGLLLLVGLAAGAGTSVEALEVAGTTWTTAQAYAILIGTLVAAFGGLAFWAPKLYGTLVPEGLARLATPLLLLGTLVVAITYGIAGLLDQLTWLAGGAAGVDDPDTIETLNLVAAIGGVVVVLGFLAGILAVVRARTAKVAAGDDPWAGHTLEWTTSSPPPVGNFSSLLEVSSEAPLYDARHRAAMEGSA